MPKNYIVRKITKFPLELRSESYLGHGNYKNQLHYLSASNLGKGNK